MAVTIEMQNTGDPRARSEILAGVEHALSDVAGEWRVSIVGSRVNDNWEMKVEGSQGFERSYTREGNHGRSDERFTRPPKVAVGGRNILVQTFASIPHASSKFWGTYLLSLCFCAHSLSGIELRYSFSDSFSLRTNSSNEVGVTGMAPIGLSQFELPLIRNFAAPHKPS
jgi:hypothetical protein